MREVFDLMDKDSGGTLSLEEIKQLMEMLGMKIPPDELEELVMSIDEDGSGQIDFEEFLQIMSKPPELPYSKAEVTRAFKLLAGDKDPDGKITPEILEKALLKYCSSRVPDEEILRLLHSLETDADGFINYEEKVMLFLSK